MNRINDRNKVCHLRSIKSLKNLQQVLLSMNGSVPLRLGMHIQQQNLHERLRFSSDQFSPLEIAIPRRNVESDTDRSSTTHQNSIPPSLQIDDDEAAA